MLLKFFQNHWLDEICCFESIHAYMKQRRLSELVEF